MKDRHLFSSERPIRSDFARGGPSYALRRIATILLAIVVLVGGGFWFMNRSSAPEEIPTIKAEGTYKERPEQPGGIDIPHQDVQVYHEIDGANDGEKATVEHMLPPPEQPTAAPATAAADPEFVTAPATEVENIAPATVKSVTAQPPASVPTPSPAAPVAEAPVPATASVPVAPTPAVVRPVPAVTATAPAAAAPVKNGVVVQFAASSDEHAASQMAQKLQTQYHGVLGSAHLHPVKADLGAKGIFYRIQSQPLSETQAKSICATVKKNNAGCLLVRP
jgi:hypothetical protein